jgi:hypothetical protein
LSAQEAATEKNNITQGEVSGNLRAKGDGDLLQQGIKAVLRQVVAVEVERLMDAGRYELGEGHRTHLDGAP